MPNMFEILVSLLIFGLPMLLLGSFVTWRFPRILRAWKLARRFGRARRLELAAARTLERNGFKVLEEQVERSATVEVDGHPQPFKVRADYLVKDAHGHRFVVEVKTGRQAPSPVYPATRRQLLEYQRVYDDVDGVLLVDMERRRVHAIQFGPEL